MGGRFISAARAKAIRAARRRAAAARSHTGIKPKPKKRNPPKRRRTARKTVTRRKATTRRKTTRTNSARAVAARKAAATRRAKAAARSAAAKKAAATRRRNARKKTTRSNPPKRRKTVARKRRRRSKASYAKAARKAAATRRRNKAKRSRAAKKGARRRKRVRSNPPAKRKRRFTGRKKRSVRYSRQKMRLRPAPRKRRKTYRLGRKTRRNKRTGRKSYTYAAKRVSRNPMTAMKAALKNTMPVFGGLLAIRVINGLLKDPLNKAIATSPTLAKYGALIAPAVGFIGACWLGPKILKGKPRFVQGLQIGATIALGDALIKQFVVPMAATITSPMAKNVVASLAGYDDMGVQGYGAYISDPTGYSLPAQHAQDIAGYGLDVQEAMALDEYVRHRGGLPPDGRRARGPVRHRVQQQVANHAAGASRPTPAAIQLGRLSHYGKPSPLRRVRLRGEDHA
jgi:hypothetical protein